MHAIAEEGIAAHWKYQGTGAAHSGRTKSALRWLRHLVEWQQEMRDPGEFLFHAED